MPAHVRLLLLLLVVVPLVLLLVTPPAAAGASAPTSEHDACATKGFDRDSLLCGTCKATGEAGGAGVLRDCLACCAQPYPVARLETSYEWLQMSAALQEFIMQRQRKFGSRVEVKYSDVAAPRLTLVGADSADNVVHRISSWTASDVENFLMQYYYVE